MREPQMKKLKNSSPQLPGRSRSLAYSYKPKLGEMYGAASCSSSMVAASRDAAMLLA